MTYGTNQIETYQQAGIYVGRILKGDKPSSLPIMQADQIRAGCQPDHSQGAGPQGPRSVPAARRRGGRVKSEEEKIAALQ
jgi:hypothetical protein